MMVHSPTEIYFLREGNGEWRVVGKQDWVRAERAAGFHNKTGKDDEPGTGGFAATKYDGRVPYSVDGRIVHVTYYKPGDYDWDPAFRDAVDSVVEAAKIWHDPKWEAKAQADWLDGARQYIFDGELPEHLRSDDG